VNEEKRKLRLQVRKKHLLEKERHLASTLAGHGSTTRGTTQGKGLLLERGDTETVLLTAASYLWETVHLTKVLQSEVAYLEHGMIQKAP